MILSWADPSRKFTTAIVVVIAFLSYCPGSLAMSKKKGPTTMTKVQEPELPLLQKAPTIHHGSFTGMLDVRKITTYSGCTERGMDHVWAVLNFPGYALPILKVTSKEADEVRAGKANDKAPIWTETDLKRERLTPGMRVTVDGVIAPVVWSGTVALTPVYGIFFTKISVASSDQALTVLTAKTQPSPSPHIQTPRHETQEDQPSAGASSLYLQIQTLLIKKGADPAHASEVIRRLKKEMKSLAEAQRLQPLQKMIAQLRGDSGGN